MWDHWSSFFALVGSAAASLSGLLFVVVTLMSGVERSRALRATGIYMTPIMLNFAVVLAGGALALVPQRHAEATAPLIGLAGLAGLAAAIRTMVGVVDFSRGVDRPHWSDFWCYGALPGVLYLGLIADAAGLFQASPTAVLVLAGLLLALLLTGIRNAWDLITWMAPRDLSATKVDDPGSAHQLGAVAGDQAGADRIAVDAGEEEPAGREIDQG